MKTIIVEDEESAVKNMLFLINEIDSTIQVIKIIDSLNEAIEFFKKNRDFDLIFMDLHLADGNALEIFKSVQPSAPVIFTTAYNQYAIDAFKLNSIDYLLKPISKNELENALNKFKQNFAFNQNKNIRELLETITIKKNYRKSFLIKKSDSLIPVGVDDFAYFYIDLGVVKGLTFEQNSFIIDHKLEEIEGDLDPDHFFRINRQYLVNRKAIKKLSYYFNGRLLAYLEPETPEKVIISKANTSKIKTWLDNV